MLRTAHSDNVMPFPGSGLGYVARRRDRRPPSADTRLPMGACLAVWTVLAGSGWGLVALALRLI